MNTMHNEAVAMTALKSLALVLGTLGSNSFGAATVVHSAAVSSSFATDPSKVQPNLSFDPCVMEMASGDTQASTSHNPAVTGSVFPLTDGIPINLDFTGTRADSSTWVGTFSTSTGFGNNPLGVYSLGFLLANEPINPFVTWFVLVTSPSISGSTTCSVAVAPAPPLFADGFENP